MAITQAVLIIPEVEWREYEKRVKKLEQEILALKNKEEKKERPLLSLRETARKLGVNATSTVSRMIYDGKLNATRQGRRLMVDAASLNNYLNQKLKHA